MKEPNNRKICTFFKNISQMINQSKTCEDLLDEINRQHEKIRMLFPKEHLEILRSCKNKVFKDLPYKPNSAIGKHEQGGFEKAADLLNARLMTRQEYNVYDKFLTFIYDKKREFC